MEPFAPTPTSTDDAVDRNDRALTLDDSGAVPHGPGYAVSTVGVVGSATVRFNHTAVASCGTPPCPRIASSVCTGAVRTPVISVSCTAPPRVSIRTCRCHRMEPVAVGGERTHHIDDHVRRVRGEDARLAVRHRRDHEAGGRATDFVVDVRCRWSLATRKHGQVPRNTTPVAVTLNTVAVASVGTISLTSIATVRPAPTIPLEPPCAGSRVSSTRFGVSGTKPEGSCGVLVPDGPLSAVPVCAFASRHLPIAGSASRAFLMNVANPTAPATLRWMPSAANHALVHGERFQSRTFRELWRCAAAVSSLL